MKNIQKSIRMSQEVYEYIAAFDGKNFNDKFENCVKFFKENNIPLKKQKIRLEIQLNELREQIEECRNIVTSLERIQTYVNFACDFVSQNE